MNINRLSSLFQVVTMSSHTFLPHALGPRPVVVDFGANRGEFYRAFIARFTAERYVAVEANPQLANDLRALPDVQVFNCAVGGIDGVVRFKLEDNPEASHVTGTVPIDIVDAVPVEARTLERILNEANVTHVDLLKVDIEGAELPMLAASSRETLAKISQITIEFHDFCGLNSAEDVRGTIRKLEENGFIGIQFSRNNTNWCFIRRDAPHRSAARCWIARQVTARLRRAKHKVMT